MPTFHEYARHPHLNRAAGHACHCQAFVHPHRHQIPGRSWGSHAALWPHIPHPHSTQDKQFDQLLASIFGDLEAFEAAYMEPAAAVLERAYSVGR
jgi:hypothetical protein